VALNSRNLFSHSSRPRVGIEGVIDQAPWAGSRKEPFLASSELLYWPAVLHSPWPVGVPFPRLPPLSHGLHVASYKDTSYWTVAPPCCSISTETLCPNKSQPYLAHACTRVHDFPVYVSLLLIWDDRHVPPHPTLHWLRWGLAKFAWIGLKP
jgi:hypothetical protein